MKTTPIRLLLLCLTLILPHAANSADTLYVQSTKAKLMDTPSFKGKVISQFDRGTKVSVRGKQDRWFHVEHQGRLGWINALLLSEHEPTAKITVLDDTNNDVSKNARRRASAIITAGATRGLTADERRRADEVGETDYVALRWVENITISEAQNTNFEVEDE